MLTIEERNWVIEELGFCLSETGDVRKMIPVIFQTHSPEILIALPTNMADVSSQASWVVVYCVADRWRKTPSLLESSLTYLINKGRRVVKFKDLRDRVAAGIDPNPDHYQARWLVGGRPFVNRGQMRILVKGFLETNDRPILVINGEADAGKSYTRNFFDYLMEEDKTITVTFSRLDKKDRFKGLIYEPKTLAEHLTLGMPQDEPMPQSSSSSYAGQLSRWIIRTALRLPTKCVMVLDGFGRLNEKGQVDLHPQTLDLIAALVELLSNGKQRQSLRLVLIDFYLPVDRALFLKEDVTTTPPPSVNDVIDCLLQWNDRRAAKNLQTISGAELPQTAGALLNRAVNGGGPVLPRLYEQLFDLNDL
jgi:hypothetical protein